MLFVKAWFFCLEPRVFREGKKQWILEEKRKFVLWRPRHVRIVSSSAAACDKCNAVKTVAEYGIWN